MSLPPTIEEEADSREGVEIVILEDDEEREGENATPRTYLALAVSSPTKILAAAAAAAGVLVEAGCDDGEDVTYLALASRMEPASDGLNPQPPVAAVPPTVHAQQQPLSLLIPPPLNVAAAAGANKPQPQPRVPATRTRRVPQYAQPRHTSKAGRLANGPPSRRGWDPMPARGVMRHVNWSPDTRQIARRVPSKDGKLDAALDLSVTGNTHRAYKNASTAVLQRRAPQRPELDTTNLALTSRSKDRWREEQAMLTKAFAAAYGTAGGGVSTKQRDLQEEARPASADEIRAEYIPKVRETVRALQETMRLKQLAATNPKILQAGVAGQARERLNNRQEAAVHRLQAACRGLSARREAKQKLSNYRARAAVNMHAHRMGLAISV